MSVTVIAEIGVNHDGDVDKAMRMCDAAKETGADIAKFQTFQPEIIRDPSTREMLRPLSLSHDPFTRIARHCEDIGIEFCATPDSIHDLNICLDLGVKRIKLGSGSLMYGPLVDAAFDTGLPVLLSTGMATRDEVMRVLNGQLYRSASRRELPEGYVTVMHCVSLYPCPPELANVRAMEQLMEHAWRRDLVQYGYSDHTMWNDAACAAVALGATVIEKHFTCGGNLSPDHAMSMNQATFAKFVQAIRATELVLGDGVKKPSPEEAAMIPRIRKGADGLQPGL